MCQLKKSEMKCGYLAKAPYQDSIGVFRVPPFFVCSLGHLHSGIQILLDNWFRPSGRKFKIKGPAIDPQVESSPSKEILTVDQVHRLASPSGQGREGGPTFQEMLLLLLEPTTVLPPYSLFVCVCVCARAFFAHHQKKTLRRAAFCFGLPTCSLQLQPPPPPRSSTRSLGKVTGRAGQEIEPPLPCTKTLCQWAKYQVLDCCSNSPSTSRGMRRGNG